MVYIHRALIYKTLLCITIVCILVLLWLSTHTVAKATAPTTHSNDIFLKTVVCAFIIHIFGLCIMCYKGLPWFFGFLAPRLNPDAVLFEQKYCAAHLMVQPWSVFTYNQGLVDYFLQFFHLREYGAIIRPYDTITKIMKLIKHCSQTHVGPDYAMLAQQQGLNIAVNLVVYCILMPIELVFIMTGGLGILLATYNVCQLLWCENQGSACSKDITVRYTLHYKLTLRALCYRILCWTLLWVVLICPVATFLSTVVDPGYVQVLLMLLLWFTEFHLGWFIKRFNPRCGPISTPTQWPVISYYDAQTLSHYDKYLETQKAAAINRHNPLKKCFELALGFIYLGYCVLCLPLGPRAIKNI